MKKYSFDNKVVFDSKHHLYNFNDKKLLSVTSLIDKFKNKFDSDFHSERIALKRGVSKDIILKEWKDKSDYSKEMGTYIHSMFENFHLGKEYKYNKLYPKSKIALKVINELYESERLIPVYSEYIVYNDFLAGQIDRIDKNLNNDLFIIDYKTNDKINYYSYNKKMTGYFNYLNDSNYFHYSIQLSIYKKLLNFEIKDMYILHIMENDYYFIKVLDLSDKIDFNELKKYI